MNEGITDPVYRTFRKPLTERLREKLDQHRATIGAQAALITKLERQLRVSENDRRKLSADLLSTQHEVVRARKALQDAQGGGI